MEKIWIIGYRSITFDLRNDRDMKTIIFKNENKAKVYEIRSTKDQGPYRTGELMRTVKTDDIEKLNENSNYEITATEITVTEN